MKEHEKKQKQKTNREIPLTDNQEEKKNQHEENIEAEQKENAGAEVQDAIEKELLQSKEKIAELEKQTIELKDLLLRKAAEFENYKRRTENDQLNLLKYAAEPFIKNILTVYDNLQRSINHINDDNSFDSLKKGLELVYDNFTKILEAQGVKKIAAKGEAFNVDLHDALLQQPVEGVPPHTVLEVVEEGYIYKDKVIRHAKVIVSAELENKNEQ